MNRSNRARFGGTLGKWLLLVAFLVLLVGFFLWKEGYGTVGHTKAMPESTAGFIAFVRDVNGQTDIFLANASGSDVRQRTDDGAAKRTPAWAPDGKLLCFSGEPKNPGPEGRTFQLYVLGEGDPQPVTYGSVSKTWPQWSPDGKLIGFLSGGAIKVIQPNGNGLKQLYPAPHAGSGAEQGSEEEHHEGDEPEQGGPRPPINVFRWSPVGMALAAVQVSEGEHALTFGQQQWWQKENRPADQPEERQSVVEPEALILLPRYDSGRVEHRAGAAAEKVSFGWFPDGNRVAVAISTRQGRHGIGAYRADDELASPEILFASQGHTVAGENPVVSPDGKKIAFELWRMNSPEDRQLLGVSIIPAEGDGVRVTTLQDLGKVPVLIKEGSKPQWSPDGKRLLFIRMGKSFRDIWVADADGSGQTNVTNGSGDNFDAVWSPAK